MNQYVGISLLWTFGPLSAWLLFVAVVRWRKRADYLSRVFG